MTPSPFENPESHFMNIAIRVSVIAFIAALLVVVISPTDLHAQGSAGGSIGNDDKSVSGSNTRRAAEPDRSGQRDRSESPSHRSSRRSGGGGNAGSFDGAWVVYGVGTTCQGSSSNAIVITSGKIIGQTARGTVSSNGTVHGYANSNGITIITTGRLSGRRGGGTFRQSDGCAGRWTAVKQ
jgi:hypothetical protein